MSSHIKTAYEYGIAEALKQAGYSSAAEFEKEAFNMSNLGRLAFPYAVLGSLIGASSLPGAALGSLIGAARAGEDHRLEGALKGGLGGGLGSILGGIPAGRVGYGLGAGLGGYLGGGMAQEEPSKLDKLRSRLGLDS